MMERRVTELETAVFGWTGHQGRAGGLVTDRDKQKARIEALELALVQVRTVVRAARWAILTGAGVLTVVNSSTLADGLVTIIRALAIAVKG